MTATVTRPQSSPPARAARLAGRRAFGLTLAVALVATLAACGSSDDSSDDGAASTTTGGGGLPAGAEDLVGRYAHFASSPTRTTPCGP